MENINVEDNNLFVSAVHQFNDIKVINNIVPIEESKESIYATPAKTIIITDDKIDANIIKVEETRLQMPDIFNSCSTKTLVIQVKKLPDDIVKKYIKPSKVKRTKEIKTFQCYICKFVTASKASSSRLRLHMRVHTGYKPYKCSLCLKAFPRLDHLKQHILTHTGERPYACNFCSWKFTYKTNLRVHIKMKHTHGNEKNHYCRICAKSFHLNRDLNKHNMIHTGVRSFACDECPSKFVTRSHLTRHKKTHLTPYQCSICRRKFSEEDTLINHKKSHTIIKRKPPKTPEKFECYLCKYWGTADGLKAHLRTHLGEKRYQCKFCLKWLAGGLKYHERIHTGERPHKCTYCLKSFNGKQTLEIHLRLHRNEKPYECQICNKTFSQRSNLRTHFRGVHGRIKPYTCEICPKSFGSRANVKDHMRRHMKQSNVSKLMLMPDTYECYICKHEVSTVHKLRLHIRLHEKSSIGLTTRKMGRK